MDSDNEIKEAVGEHYAEVARQAAQRAAASCCQPQPSCCAPAESEVANPTSSRIYAPEELKEVPLEALLASAGCGNPVALAELHPGEVVLDLGSGGGIDVLLSARRVGPTGKAYGLDMVDEMLELARENQKKAGIENVEFLKGEMENIPLPDDSVDVIISNCVVNLSPDKDRVLHEAYRVLKPGGRLAISDLITRGDIPAELRRNLELWVSCLAGALREDEYVVKLKATGFRNVGVEVTRVWTREDIRGTEAAEIVDRLEPGAGEQALGSIVSAFVRAQKPAARATGCRG